MVREYVKKTARGTTSLEVMEEGARRVIDKKESLRNVAADFDVSKTLLYHVGYIGYLLLVYLYSYIYGYENGLIYGCVEEDTLY